MVMDRRTYRGTAEVPVVPGPAGAHPLLLTVARIDASLRTQIDMRRAGWVTEPDYRRNVDKLLDYRLVLAQQEATPCAT